MVNRRRQLARACKKYGLVLQPNTVDPLLRFMDSVHDDDDDGAVLVEVLGQLQNKLLLAVPVGGPKLITLPLLEQVLEEQQQQRHRQRNMLSSSSASSLLNSTTVATANRSGGTTSGSNYSSNDQRDDTRSSFTVSRYRQRLGSTITKSSSSSSSWQIISAFTTPKLTYDSMRQQFRYEGITNSGSNNNNNDGNHNNTTSLMGSAKSLLDMRTRRFTLVHQRVVRSRQQRNLPDLTTIDRLLGSTTTSNSNNTSNNQQVLLGMLRSNPSLGCLDLEDLTGSIVLQITIPNSSSAVAAAVVGGGGGRNSNIWNDNTGITSPMKTTHIDQKGLYMEGSIVLVYGIYDNGIFRCSRIELPPLEASSESKPYLPPPLLAHGGINGSNLLRGGTSYNNQHHHNHTEPPVKIYSMSNVALDDSDCIQRLEGLLAKLQADDDNDDDNDDGPALLVLFGNFVTESMTLPTALDELARLIQDVHPRHTVLIIPGPLDAVPNSVWPLPPLLGSSSKKSLLHQMSNVRFGTNPCRLNFVREDGHIMDVVLLRKDMIRESLQHQVLGNSCDGSGSGTAYGTTTSPLAGRVIHHMMSQGHIMPQSPTYWNYDHAMGLYPLPDLMILGLDGDFDEGMEYGRAQSRVVVPGSSQQGVQITLGRKSRLYVEFLSDQHGYDEDDHDDDHDEAMFDT